MCVIAGYIGKRKAAPILVEMLRKEEGLDAGFFTGIATIHEGKLHYRKIVGDLETLLAETDALDLPGNIGFAHSRTPGRGDREWAHPFTDISEGIAYIANGGRGKYSPQALIDAGNKLLDQGISFKSAEPITPDNPPGKVPLKNNCNVHTSELVCLLISQHFENEEKTPRGLSNAITLAYEETMGSIVGLCIHAKQPDTIVIARHNQPMEIGRDVDGDMYLATTTIAFPENIEWQTRMAPLSSAICHRDGTLQILPFRDHSRLMPLGTFPSSAAIMGRVKEAFAQKNPQHMSELRKVFRPLWAEMTLGEVSIVLYELLAALLEEDRVELEHRRIPGKIEGTTVPRTFIKWKNIAELAN